MKTEKSIFVGAGMLLLLSACGGGGSGSSSAPTSGGSGSGTGTAGPFTVGVLVTGLAPNDTPLILTDNTTDTLSVPANGSATFKNTVASGGTFNVVVATQPTHTTCAISAGSGAVSNDTVVDVVCGVTESINTTVPAPVYSADSALKTAFFNDLNTFRGQLGLSLLAQNTDLDTETQAHALYLSVNYTAAMESGNDPATNLLWAHSEDVGLTDFYAATPQLRAVKSGYATSANYGEVGEVAFAYLASGSSIASTAQQGDVYFKGFISTVMHRAILLNNSARDIGIGFVAPQGEIVVDPGSTGLTQITPTTYSYTYPVNGSIFIEPAWTSGAENPNPTPSITTGTPIGGPISIFCGADHTIAPTNYTLTDGTGNTVATIPVNFGNAGFIIPTAPLNLGASYTASFTGTCGGSAFTKTWTFTTPQPVITASANTLTMTGGQSVSFTVNVPSGSFNANPLGTTGYFGGYTMTLVGNTYTFTTPANVNGATVGTATFQVVDNFYPGVAPQTVTITINP